MCMCVSARGRACVCIRSLCPSSTLSLPVCLEKKAGYTVVLNREVTWFAPEGVHEVWIRGYSEAKLLDADPEFHRYSYLSLSRTGEREISRTGERERERASERERV